MFPHKADANVARPQRCLWHTSMNQAWTRHGSEHTKNCLHTHICCLHSCVSGCMYMRKNITHLGTLTLTHTACCGYNIQGAAFIHQPSCTDTCIMMHTRWHALYCSYVSWLYVCFQRIHSSTSIHAQDCFHLRHMIACRPYLEDTFIHIHTYIRIRRKLISALSHQLKAPLLGVVSLGRGVLDDNQDTDVHVSFTVSHMPCVHVSFTVSHMPCVHVSFTVSHVPCVHVSFTVVHMPCVHVREYTVRTSSMYTRMHSHMHAPLSIRDAYMHH